MASPQQRRDARYEHRSHLVEDVRAGIKAIMRIYLEAFKRQAAAGKEAKEGKANTPPPMDITDVQIVVDTDQADHLVGCLERCFLYGLKTKQSKKGSFWEMILALADVIEKNYGNGGRFSSFFSDVKFASSLQLNNDGDMTARGRAWIRYVLMCSRMSETLKLVAYMQNLFFFPNLEGNDHSDLDAPLMVHFYEPYALWVSEEHIEILITCMRQLVPIRFNLELHKAVPYRWKRVDGFYSKVRKVLIELRTALINFPLRERCTPQDTMKKQ